MSIFKISKFVITAGLICMAGAFGAGAAFAQNGTPESPWNIGRLDNPGGAGAVTAYMSEQPGGVVLTISGTGQMRDFSRPPGTNAPPWNANGNSRITEVVIQEGVTNVGGSAFYELTGLKTVRITGSVAMVARDAFENCTALEAITFLGATPPIFADAAQSINATLGTASAENIRVYVPEGAVEAYRHSIWGQFHSVNAIIIIVEEWDCSGSGPHDTYDGIDSVRAVLTSDGTLTISGVGYMMGSGYYNWTLPWEPNSERVTSVVIEDGVMNVGMRVFDNFANLTSVTIGNSVRSIDFEAFNHSGLTSVTIPDNVIEIAQSAFEGCSDLTNVTIGRGMEVIGSGAFSYCYGLMSITSLNTVPPEVLPRNGTSSEAFEGVTACLYVPQASIDAYKAAYGWKDFDCVQAAPEEIASSVYSTRPAVRTTPAAAAVSVRGRMLNVSSPNSSGGTMSIRMIDMRGKTVARFAGAAVSGRPLSFALSGIPSGRYFVEVRNGVRRDRSSVVVGVN